MITPIIMESDIDIVGQKLAELTKRHSSRLHIDIGDGLFSDLLTISPADLQQFDLSPFGVDIHLLVDDPAEWIEESVALGPERLIGQIERMGSQVAFLQAIKSYGETKGGLALAINTPIEEIEPEALTECSVVLLLAVPSGTSGSNFDLRVIEKIRALRAIYQGPILIDGGITRDTYEQAIEAGATEAGANSSYWKGLL
jgi:pentose-5-phosphate-3-epimerase